MSINFSFTVYYDMISVIAFKTMGSIFLYILFEIDLVK